MISALKKNQFLQGKQTLRNLTTLEHFFHNELTKDEKYSWLQEQNTKVLKQSIRDLLDAYSHFFNEHKGFPKYKLKLISFL